MKPFNVVVIAGLFAATAAPARVWAQQPQQKDSARKAPAIPADARPPKGMCRIWLDNVPPAQQPAATDCTTAIRNRPSNGHVIFGDDFADSAKAKATDKSKLPPNIKGFTEVKPASVTLPKRPPPQD